MMRVGLYRPVHVKTLTSQKQRMLLTARQLLKAKAIDIESDLRGTLRNFGLKVGVVGEAKFEARIRELIKDDPDLTEIVEPVLIARRTLRQQLGVLHRQLLELAFGLTPRRYQSGETDRMGAVSKWGDRMMRAMLFEAALALMVCSRKWSWLKAWGMKIARHRGIKRAIVAVARRLAVILHRMWVDGTEFRWTREQAAAA